MKIFRFKSFNNYENGRVISSNKKQDVVYVYCRNPYGTHNLITVDTNKEEAFRHGNQDSLDFASGTKTYRRLVRFLISKKGITNIKRFNT